METSNTKDLQTIAKSFSNNFDVFSAACRYNYKDLVDSPAFFATCLQAILDKFYMTGASSDEVVEVIQIIFAAHKRAVEEENNPN